MPIFDKPLYPKATIVSKAVYYFLVALALALILLAFDQQVAGIFNGFFEDPNPPYYPYFKHYLPVLVAAWGALVGLYDLFQRKFVKYSGAAVILNLAVVVLYSLTFLIPSK